MILEKDIEEYLVKKIKDCGGLCLKFTSPGTRGVPDRVVLFDGEVHFIELKKPGETPRKDQLKMISAFNDQYIPVYIIDTKQGVDDFIKRVL